MRNYFIICQWLNVLGHPVVILRFQNSAVEEYTALPLAYQRTCR